MKLQKESLRKLAIRGFWIGVALDIGFVSAVSVLNRLVIWPQALTIFILPFWPGALWFAHLQYGSEVSAVATSLLFSAMVNGIYYAILFGIFRATAKLFKGSDS